MFSNKKEKRRVYRIAPCPSYDVEGMESWLTDMAGEGLLLSRDGFFAGVASFERTYPQNTQNIKYRLEAAQKSTSMWSDNGGEPDDEAVEISEKYGWEYVAKRGDFYIYRSSNPTARELNTDPAVQAIALNAVRKRQRIAAFACLFWAVINPIIGIRGNLFLLMVNIRTWFFLFGMILLLWLLASSVSRVVHLSKLQKKLSNDGVIDHRKNWRSRASHYHIGKVIKGVLIVVWVCILLQKWSISIADEGSIPLADYTANPPFATIADFSPDGEYSENDFLSSNMVREWSDLLCPYNIDWTEIATIKHPDGTSLSGGLYVDYHMAASPWIAEKIAHEYLRTDKHKKNFEPLKLPPLDVDYAVAYLDSIHFPTVVLRDGNKVIHATFYQTSQDYEMPLEEWAGILAESLR